MGKFKKGDWVRRTNGTSFSTVSGHHGPGFVGQVEDSDGYGDEVVFTNGHKGFADQYEPWQPKVGERVRVPASANSVWAGDAEVVAYYATYGTYNVKMLTGRCAGVDGDFLLSEVEPVIDIAPATPVAAPLKIEAGKYYRTRDGRKVGPAEDYILSGWKGWTLSSFLYQRDGKHGDGDDYTGLACVPNKPELDLVALWEEPAVAVAASNDNCVKVGDKVRALTDDIDITEGHVYDVLQVYEDGDVRVEDDAGDNWTLYRDNFELVTPAVANDNAAPAKPKFRVGDRVVLARSFSGAALVGATGKVGVNGMYDSFVDIIWDKNDLSNGQLDGGYFPDTFELVTSSNPAIVCLIENGQPKPADRPFVHPDEQGAAKEASRLAGVHKGKEFGVYVLTSTAKEERTYDHEWQRLAAKGEKIAAIRELRDLAGLTLRGAKDAVEAWVSYQAAA